MGSVSRVLFTRQSLRADLEGFRGKYSYPLGSTNEEKRQRMTRLRLSWELVNLKRIQGSLSETHSQESYAYASPDASLRSQAKDYAKKEDVLLGTLGYRPRESMEGTLLLRRAQSKNNYPNQPINTQSLDSKYLEVRAQARPNSSSVLEFVQTLGLDSYDFPHPFNFNARDLGSASSFFRSTILASKTTRIGASVLARQDHLVYVRPEMSANNRWTRSYQVAPLLSFTPFSWLLWTQSYALRADYNLYDFASRSNLLLRSVTVQDSLRFARPGREDCLLLSLGAQVQSQGPYLYDQASKRYGYYTSQENARYSVGLSAVRRVRGMRLTPGYFYERRRITDFLPDTSYTRLLPSPRSRVIVQDLTLGAELAPWRGSSLSLAVTRSLRQGEVSYWDARLLLDWKI
jgi:hypothetical protein